MTPTGTPGPTPWAASSPATRALDFVQTAIGRDLIAEADRYLIRIGGDTADR
jgi:hypothetical protein